MGILFSQLTRQHSQSQSEVLVLDAPGHPQEIGVLFGSSLNPWVLSDWKEVSDTVRGGSSVARLDLLQSDFPAAGIRFHGTLDTATLGGAGFASQAYRARYPLSFPSETFSGLVLEIGPLPLTSSTLLRNFTLVLKNELAPSDSEGRQQSTTSYEFDFSVPFATSSSDKDDMTFALDQRLSISIPFSELRPSYRGRPKPDAKKFDPSHITELSFMCRSFFNKQNGSFDLNIFRLGIVYITHDSTSDGKTKA